MCSQLKSNLLSKDHNHGYNTRKASTATHISHKRHYNRKNNTPKQIELCECSGFPGFCSLSIDHDVEFAGRGRWILLGDGRQAREPAGPVVLVVLLVVAVERIRDVSLRIQIAARRLVSEAGAVCVLASVADARRDLGVVEAHRRLQHAPLRLQVLDVLRPDE